ncbi:toxin-antitoxin system YwqK family antitoxin [Sinomicrobium sp.]
MKILPCIALFLVACSNAQIKDTVRVNSELQVHFINKTTKETDSLYVLDKNKEVYFKGYVKDSLVTYYDPDGIIYLKGQFYSNRLNGLVYIYENGKLFSYSNYKNGIKYGFSITFDDNMKVRNIVFHSNKYKDKNTIHMLFQNGVPMSITTGMFSDEKLNMEFHENGALMEIFQRLNRDHNSKEFPLYYDENGKPLEKEEH